MDDQRDANQKRGSLLWLLVFIAVIALWWFLGPSSPEGSGVANVNVDRAGVLDMDPDDIVVDLVDEVDQDVIAEIERELALDLVLVSDESRDEGLYRARIEPEQRTALLAALNRHPAVEIAEPDARVSLGPVAAHRDSHLGAGEQTIPPDAEWEGYPNDPMYRFQWHMRQIGMPEAWKLADGEGVIVAVIDTGVAFDNRKSFHVVPDLDGITFVHPYNFVANNDNAHDDHGHGTHVAGTIAQMTHNEIGVTGIAHKVKIMPLKVLGANGSGSAAGIADAIHYAADKGAKVINMSLGSRFPSRIMKKAVEYAHSKGVVVVCAAGNDGRGSVSYPAAYPGAIAVSATQFDETITFYSNYGKEIDIAAPGGNTRVDQNDDGMPDGVLQNTIAIGDPTRDDYFPFMGTSMASPHVAGVAALVVGEGVTEPDAVEKILKDNAREPKEAEFDSAKYGAGIVDAPAAVNAARSEAGGWQLLLGLLVAGAAAASVRRRGLLGIKLGPAYLSGVLFGASGLFFLPPWPVIDAFTRGLPSWGLALVGPAGYGNVLFFSALIPLGLIALLYNVRRLRGLLAGLAAGVAGHLLFHAAVRVVDISYIPNVLALDQVWLVLNALACIGMAMLVMRRS